MGSGFCKVRSLKEPVEQNSVTIYVILERNQTCLSVDARWLCRTHFDFAFNSDFQFLAKNHFALASITLHLWQPASQFLWWATLSHFVNKILQSMTQTCSFTCDLIRSWVCGLLEQEPDEVEVQASKHQFVKLPQITNNVFLISSKWLEVARCCPWVHNPYSGLPSFRGQLKTLNF